MLITWPAKALQAHGGKPDAPIDAIVMELTQEAATIQRLLGRIPAQHLTWKPHERFMTMGRLATHIAEIPGRVSTILDKDSFDIGASN